MKVKGETIARTVVTLLALINSVLVIMGKNVLPWTEDEIYQACTAVLAVATTIWSWWKNNSFTFAALKADEYKDDLKAGLKK